MAVAAMLCLAGGWLHIWHHAAEAGHEEHDGAAEAPCLLADHPPIGLPAAPICAAPERCTKDCGLPHVAPCGQVRVSSLHIRAPPPC